MRSRRLFFLMIAAVLGALAGCSDYEHRERPPWRAQAEQACIAKDLVHESSAIRAFHAMEGPGICGATHPFKVTALAEGSVAFNSTETLDCPMIAALDEWLRGVVQPAAQARFGEPVVKINAMGSYSCRGINNMSGANLSEHAFANAIDIGGFVLASGRELNIMRGFNGADEQERAFLHEVHAGACNTFTTVLGPGYNVFHYNHFHMDLAMHGMTSRGARRYCKPVPQTGLPSPPVKDNLPDPPPLEEELDIARAPLPAPALRGGPPTLMASAPPPIPMRAAAASPRPADPAAPTGDAAFDRPRLASIRRAPSALPLEPKIAAGDPPLISFAEPDLPLTRTLAARIHAPGSSLRMGPAADAAGPQDAEPAPTSPTMPRRRGPAEVEGAPRDWDATSSIGR